jgi:hypothetical protein
MRNYQDSAFLLSAARLDHFGPRRCASPKWAHVNDAMGPEEQRRTGAGSFVWSSAIQNNLPVTWNLLRIGGEVFD